MLVKLSCKSASTNQYFNINYHQLVWFWWCSICARFWRSTLQTRASSSDAVALPWQSAVYGVTDHWYVGAGRRGRAKPWLDFWRFSTPLGLRNHGQSLSGLWVQTCRTSTYRVLQRPCFGCPPVAPVSFPSEKNTTQLLTFKTILHRNKIFHSGLCSLHTVIRRSHPIIIFPVYLFLIIPTLTGRIWLAGEVTQSWRGKYGQLLFFIAYTREQTELASTHLGWVARDWRTTHALVE
jgi:hypothetical protein